jgi:hypothetical protein
MPIPGLVGSIMNDFKSERPSTGFGKFVSSPVTQGVGMLGLSAIPVGLGLKSYFDNKKQQEQEHQLTLHKKILDIDASANRARMMRAIAPTVASPTGAAAVIRSEPLEDQPAGPKTAGIGKILAGVEKFAPHINTVANGAMILGTGKDLLTKAPPPPRIPVARPGQANLDGPKLAFIGPILSAARIGASMLSKAAPAINTAANVAGAASAVAPSTPKVNQPKTSEVQLALRKLATSIAPPSAPHSGPGVTSAPKPITQTPKGTPGATGAFTQSAQGPKTATIGGFVADTARDFKDGASHTLGAQFNKMLSSEREVQAPHPTALPTFALI